jgi:TP901 family phage tail tape measure protein
MAADLSLQVILGLKDKILAPLTRVQSRSESLGQALSASKEKLKALEDTQRLVQRFNDLSEQIGGNSAALKAAREQMDAYKSSMEQQRGIQAQLAGQVKTQRQAFKQLQQQMTQGTEPNQKLTQEYLIARDALAKLESQYNTSKNELTTFQRGIKEQGATLAHLNAKGQGYSEQLAKVRGKLDAAGISSERLGDHEKELAAQVEQTNQALKQQKAQLEKLNVIQKKQADIKAQHAASMKHAAMAGAGGYAAIAGARSVASPIGSVMNAFAPAEDAATQLRASMMGSDGTVAADFEKISTLATQLGDRLPGTTADYLAMMTMLRRQGLSAQTILQGTGEASAYLAAQLQLPVTEAAEFAAKMQDATRTSERDMMGLMDMIQRTYYLGVDSDNMLQGFSKISPALGILRKSGLDAANTVAPLLVMMDQMGTTGETAGNALRKIFQAGLNTKKVAKANKSLAAQNISLDFTDGKGEFGGLDKLFAQLNKLKKLTAAQRTSVLGEIFGDDGDTLGVLNTLMDKGMSGYQEVAAKMQQQADLRKRVDEQLSTLSNVMGTTQGNWQNALKDIGATIAPELKALLQQLSQLASAVGTWARENPQLTASLLKVLGAAAAALTLFGGLAIAVATVLGPFSILRMVVQRLGLGLLSTGGAAVQSAGLISRLGGAIWTAISMAGKAILLLSRVLLTNPILLGIAAIATAVYLIYKNWDSLVPYFRNLCSSVVSSLSPLIGMVTGIWGQIKDGVNGGLSGIAALIINFSPLGWFYKAFAGVMSYFSIELPATFTGFGGMLIDGLIAGVTNKLGELKDSINNAGSNAVGWMKEKLGIHSPSRVFAELGQFTLQGFNQGLVTEQSGTLATLKNVTGQLVKAGTIGVALGSAQPLPAMTLDTRAPIAAPASTTPASVVVQGDSITINVNGAGNGAQLAQEIRRILDERERTKAVRMRSALSDRD